MAKLYLVQNGAMPTTAPFQGVVTSATLYTTLQVVPATNSPLKIVEWGVSFDGAALASPFVCELVETGVIGATVTALAAADVMPYDDPNAPANTAGATGIPLNLTGGAVAASGYTSTAEGTTTTARVFDSQFVDPAAGYSHRFELGREPGIAPQKVCRVRVKGDGTRKVIAYLILEV